MQEQDTNQSSATRMPVLVHVFMYGQKTAATQFFTNSNQALTQDHAEAIRHWQLIREEQCQLVEHGDFQRHHDN